MGSYKTVTVNIYTERKSSLITKKSSLKNELEDNPHAVLSYMSPKGTLTLEASLIVPILAMILVMVLFGFRMLQVQTCVETAINHAAKETAVYAAETGDDDETKLKLLGIAMATKWLNKTQCPTEYIKGKALGISYLNTNAKGDYITIIASYKMSFPFEFFYKKTSKITQTAISRKWTGYDKSNMGEGDDEIVYVTKSGTAYHSSTSCHYLSLSIQTVLVSSVSGCRNISGAKYYACPLCCKNNITQSVYITDYGTNYHTSLTCSGLKRTIYTMSLMAAKEKGYHACSKCY